MCAGCGSRPSTSSSYAVPGAFIDRSATPCTAGVKMPAPISHDASAAVWPRTCCSVRAPNTSATDSLSAPDCPEYSRPPECSTTPWPSSCAMTLIEPVNPVNTSPSPSPNTIRSPFQNALSYFSP